MSDRKRGINAVCWWTSPACARILEHIECKGPKRPDELSARLHITKKYAENLTRLLEANNVVYVTRWRRNLAGAPTAVYALGNRKSKPKPKPETSSVRCKRRRDAMVAKYGVEIANKVLNPGHYGHPIIVIDGERVTPASARAYVGGGR